MLSTKLSSRWAALIIFFYFLIFNMNRNLKSQITRERDSSLRNNVNFWYKFWRETQPDRRTDPQSGKKRRREVEMEVSVKQSKMRAYLMYVEWRERKRRMETDRKRDGRLLKFITVRKRKKKKWEMKWNKGFFEFSEQSTSQ